MVRDMIADCRRAPFRLLPRRQSHRVAKRQQKLLHGYGNDRIRLPNRLNALLHSSSQPRIQRHVGVIRKTFKRAA